MNVLALLFGLIGLWLGTELTIRGAVAVAKRFSLPDFVVGVAILSVGSDLPELAIAIDGAVQNLGNGATSDVVVGSALGSALGQIGFVLGLTGLFGYMTLPRQLVYRHGSILLGALLLLALVGFDGTISRIEGMGLIVVYAIYFVLLITEPRRSAEPVDTSGLPSTLRATLYVVVGLAVVTLCAEVSVSAVTDIAAAMGIEQSLIAITVIGLGTSLPELSISLSAILKRRRRLSVGNLIGSNIFDTLMPVGTAAMISELDFSRTFLVQELPFLFVLSTLVLIFFMRKKGIQKYEAATILSLYCAYALVKIFNS